MSHDLVRLGPILLLAALAGAGGCAIHSDSAAERTAPQVRTPDACLAPPMVIGGKFRHLKNRMYASLGEPRHRGVDLIAVETDKFQTLGGKLAYTAADKDIEDEDVEVFACESGAWKPVGVPTTDAHGRFRLVLSGDRRLPPGMRDLYAFVPGDHTAFRFLAFVARPGESAIVTDIDGTVTASEAAIINTVLFGDDIGHRANAPRALAESGHPVIYMSSRGDQLTTLTREWLRDHGFPLGPLRLARSGITRPGPATVRFKAAALEALSVPITAGIGNRASDVEAYAQKGIPANRIFVKLPEFQSELAPLLAAHRAVPFVRYAAIANRLE